MKKSQLEQRFDLIWDEVVKEMPAHAKDLQLVDEYPFAKSVGRRFRFDRCHMDQRVAIEIMGGTYVGGRHTSPSGYKKDCEKMLIAAELHWQMIYLTCDMVDIEHLRRIASVILSRSIILGPNHDWVISHTTNQQN